jgi:hypothetical protein
MTGFFILVEIQKEALKNKNLINFGNIKNPFIKKYADEILDLRKKENGSKSNYSSSNSRDRRSSLRTGQEDGRYNSNQGLSQCRLSGSFLFS